MRTTDNGEGKTEKGYHLRINGMRPSIFNHFDLLRITDIGYRMSFTHIWIASFMVYNVRIILKRFKHNVLVPIEKYKHMVYNVRIILKRFKHNVLVPIEQWRNKLE